MRALWPHRRTPTASSSFHPPDGQSGDSCQSRRWMGSWWDDVIRVCLHSEPLSVQLALWITTLGFHTDRSWIFEVPFIFATFAILLCYLQISLQLRGLYKGVFVSAFKQHLLCPEGQCIQMVHLYLLNIWQNYSSSWLPFHGCQPKLVLNLFHTNYWFCGCCYHFAWTTGCMRQS